jgi:NAD(P)-dependent dehydrogenase (short-subunit alcohol dehydrogenase family)
MQASRKADACVAAAAAFNRDYSSLPGGGACHALGGHNLSTDAGCRQLAAALAAETAGLLHVLINNSGTSWGQPLEEYAEEGWSKVLALNLLAPFQLTRACLPLLDAAATPTDPARVINIGSISGLRHQPFPTYAYDASKAALHSLTRKLAAELAARPNGAGGRQATSITVNAIAPGYVPTNMSAQLSTYAAPASVQASIPLGRWGQGSDMAGAALFFAGNGSGAWVTGVVLPVDGGMLAAPLRAGDGGLPHPALAADQETPHSRL